MTGQTRRVAAIVVALTAATAGVGAGCRQKDAPAPQGPAAPDRGGDLVTMVRTDPGGFNWYTHRDNPTHLLADLMQARLVRINRATWELEPWLAEKWEGSSDGLRYAVHLRRNVTWSDGQPFTADDVVFSLKAAYDTRRASSPTRCR